MHYGIACAMFCLEQTAKTAHHPFDVTAAPMLYLLMTILITIPATVLKTLAVNLKTHAVNLKAHIRILIAATTVITHAALVSR